MAKKNSKSTQRTSNAKVVRQTKKEKTVAPSFHNSQDVKREQQLMIKNGLGNALGFGDSNIFGPNAGGVQLSQVDTLFKNQRWYLVSNMRQILSELYIESGLIQVICRVPVDDGLRGGVEIKSKQLSEEQIEELLISVDRDDDLNVVADALTWNRLYGGAGIIIMTDQDPSTPLDLEAIGEDSPLEFRAVDMWELFWDKQNTEGYDPEIQQEEFEHYNYYAKKIHKSRVMRMKGLTPPSFLRPRLRGWGFSVVEHLVRSVNQYLKATNLTFEVLDEFKLDVFKLKNLTNTLMSPQGDADVAKRVRIANAQKNYQNAIVLDSEDDFDHKQLSFAGLAEVMKGIREQIASDMRMPMTKIFGISAAGFNSGEDDIEVYNSMVESQVRNKCKYDILRLLEIKCQKKFGMIPDDLSITFKPLRVMSAEQQENVKSKKFDRALAAKTAGEMTTKEFREVCNKDELFSVKLDTSMDSINETDADVASESGEPKTDDPGANKIETRAPKAKPNDSSS